MSFNDRTKSHEVRSGTGIVGVLIPDWMMLINEYMQVLVCFRWHCVQHHLIYWGLGWTDMDIKYKQHSKNKVVKWTTLGWSNWCQKRTPQSRPKLVIWMSRRMTTLMSSQKQPESRHITTFLLVSRPYDDLVITLERLNDNLKSSNHGAVTNLWQVVSRQMTLLWLILAECDHFMKTSRWSCDRWLTNLWRVFVSCYYFVKTRKSSTDDLVNTLWRFHDNF